MLTLIAMATYPGGTYVDPATIGFSFFDNFFSDLGRTATRLGGPQTLSHRLFTTALLLVSAGLVTFFVAFAGLVRRNGLARALAVAGSVAGCAAGACFAGIALVPADIDLALHDRLVQWAYRAFLAAVLLYIVALGRDGELPPRFRRAFASFALLLALYVLLIEFGPSPREPGGQTIQATGQKIIVYASILCIGAQALWARRLLARPAPAAAGLQRGERRSSG